MSCEVDDFVETRLCKLCAIFRPRVLVLGVLYDLMQELYPSMKEKKSEVVERREFVSCI